MRSLTGRPWEVSAMIDRVRFPGPGMRGGRESARGEFTVDGETKQPKSLLPLAPNAHVALNLPGGGGYGDPAQRPVESVLHDVVEGYVSLAAAERDYKVAIRYPGSADQLVRLAAHYAIDQERARQLRAAGPTP